MILFWGANIECGTVHPERPLAYRCFALRLFAPFNYVVIITCSKTSKNIKSPFYSNFYMTEIKVNVKYFKNRYIKKQMEYEPILYKNQTLLRQVFQFVFLAG